MKLPPFLFAAAAVLLTALGPVSAAPTEVGRLTRLGDASYGSALDASGNLAIVGNRTRAVDIGRVEPRTVELLSRDPASGAWSRVKLLSAPEPGRYFGWSVAIDGDNVAVGAPSLIGTGQDQPNSELNGRVYIYSRNTGGANAWGLQRTIEGSSQGTGMRVALSGTTLAVGTPSLLAGVVPAIRIHERNQGGALNWGEARALPIPPVSGVKGPGERRFGTNFDLDGDTLVIGALDDIEGYDQVWVHFRNQGGAGQWGLRQELLPPAPGARLGLQVAIDGSRIAATGRTAANAPFVKYYWQNKAGDFSGSDSYFTGVAGIVADRRVALSGELVAVMDRLANGDLQVQVNRWDGSVGEESVMLCSRTIGREERSDAPYALALTDDAVLAGADRVAGDPPAHRAGIVRPLNRNTGGTDQFGPLAALTPSLTGSATFGKAMAMAGRYLLVGDPDAPAGGTARGAAYLFQRGPSSTDAAGESWRLFARIGPPAASSDNAKFGSAVSITAGGNFLIGAPGEAGGGVAYFYRPSTWGFPQFITSFTRSLTTGDIRFGSSVAVVNAGEVLVGAPGMDTGGTNAGAVFYYRLSGSSWFASALTRSDPDGNPGADQFGNALAFSGNQLAVSAWTDEGNGAVYMFTYTAATSSFAQNAKLQPADNSRGFFGVSLGLREDRLVVGVFGFAIFVPLEGDAFVFERVSGTWTQKAQLGPASLENGDFMGDAVAIGRDFVIAGAPGDDGAPVAPSTDRGIAYRYRRGATDWTLTDTLTPDYLNDAGTLIVTGAPQQRFGAGAAAAGDSFALSAPGYAGIGADTGIVRFYRYGPYEQWTEAYALPATGRGLYDDPDRDGRVNLIEYAIDSHPLNGGGAGRLSYSLVASGGATHLQGRLVRSAVPVVRSDISCQFQGGSNLRFLSTSNVEVLADDATELRGILEDSVQVAPTGFMRLEVTYIGSSAP